MRRLAAAAVCLIGLLALPAGCNRATDTAKTDDQPPPGPPPQDDDGLAARLTQTGQFGRYSLSLPPDYAAVPMQDRPQLELAAWSAKAADGRPVGVVSAAVFSDPKLVADAGKGMRQTLVNYSAGVTDSSGCKITARGPTRTNTAGGLDVTRFAFEGTGPDGTPMKGVTFGAIDGDRVVTAVAAGFGDAAAEQARLFEDVADSLRKK